MTRVTGRWIAERWNSASPPTSALETPLAHATRSHCTRTEVIWKKISLLETNFFFFLLLLLLPSSFLVPHSSFLIPPSSFLLLNFSFSFSFSLSYSVLYLGASGAEFVIAVTNESTVRFSSATFCSITDTATGVGSALLVVLTSPSGLILSQKRRIGWERNNSMPGSMVTNDDESRTSSARFNAICSFTNGPIRFATYGVPTRLFNVAKNSVAEVFPRSNVVGSPSNPLR